MNGPVRRSNMMSCPTRYLPGFRGRPGTARHAVPRRVGRLVRINSLLLLRHFPRRTTGVRSMLCLYLLRALNGP